MQAVKPWVEQSRLQSLLVHFRFTLCRHFQLSEMNPTTDHRIIESWLLESFALDRA